MNVFEHLDYKALIKAAIAENKKIRGYQARLAEGASCQGSYLSQVLNSHIQLTPDQAAGLTVFWNLDEEEAEYFLALVHFARASSNQLKAMLSRRVQYLRQKNQDIAERLQSPALAIKAGEQTYYSAWYWMAIHMITGIPAYQTAPAIANRLSLPLKLVNSCLQSLEGLALVEKKGSRWISLNRDLHLDKRSPLISTHHANWRLRANADIQMGTDDSLHFSSVHTLSRDDIEKLKHMMLEFIEKSRKVVAPSPEEKIVGICLDLFRL